MSPFPVQSPTAGTPTTVAAPIPPSPTTVASPSGPASTPHLPGKKSSKTCATCRARKVRCDGRRDVCSNCERLGFTCSYEDSHPEFGGTGLDGAPAVNPPRKRVRHACTNCHSRKARCSGDAPKCSRCLNQNLQCVYLPTKRTRLGGQSFSASNGHVASPTGTGNDGHSPLSSSDPRESNGDNDSRSPRRAESQRASVAFDSGAFAAADSYAPPDELVARALESFFRHIHHIPMVSFLHKASVMQRYHAKSLDKALLLSIIGITSLLVDLGPGIRDYGRRCINDAETLVLSDLEKPSTVKVQTLCLIIKHHLMSRRSDLAFMLISIASRYATILRLNHEQPHLCFLARESRRRLMWALFMMDSAAALGHEDFGLWNAERIRLQLPCNERNFEVDLPQATENLIPPPRARSEDLGNLAFYIRIFWLRSRVMAFGRSVRTGTHQDVVALPAGVAALARELDDFSLRLPQSFRYTVNNLRLRMYTQRLCVFAMVHIWWRQCHIDLYGLSMSGLVDALPQNILDQCDRNLLMMYRKHCLDHALAMSDIFSAMLSLDTGIPVTDFDFPMCAYQCAKTLHTAYVTSASELRMSPADTMERLERCLRVVKASCNGCPIVLKIRSDVEQLIRDGLNSTPSPSDGATPMAGSDRSDHRDGRVGGEEGMSRHSVIKQMDIVDDSGIGEPPAPEERLPEVVGEQMCRESTIHSGNMASPSTIPGQLPLPNQGFDNFFNGLDAESGLGMGIQSTKPLDMPMHGTAGVPAVSLSGQNNAFEGATDPTSFNMETFSSESLPWLNNEWMGVAYPPQQ